MQIVLKTKKRPGRGAGSGKGFHTTGRGQKGQKARYKVNILFEGVKTKKSLLHRLPMLPGKGRFKAQEKPVILSIEKLNMHPAGDVTVGSLIANKLIAKKDVARGVKLIGDGAVEKKFALSIKASQKAADAVVAAGGTIA